jgi:hypothetical protein
MRIAYYPCHSILEYDELRLLSELGHEVASLGAYINPAAPLDNLRPPLDVPMVELVKREVDALGQQGHTDTLDAAKRHTPDAIIDWAEVIIVAGMEHTYLAPQWDRLKHKRVIWRTIGQSGDRNEQMMEPLHKEGMQIVRYSPKERNIPSYAGEDALIRFYKDPADYGPWIGDQRAVTNITQNLYRRSLADDGGLQAHGYQWTSYSFWEAATRGLPTAPGGPGSEVHGGLGPLTFERMKEVLAACRAYLFTGTQPASYTLGFMEALMTGIPLVSIGPSWMKILPYGAQMFEAHELAPIATEDPAVARKYLQRILVDDDYAQAVSRASRQIAVDNFGIDTIKEQWADFLDGVEVRTPELAAAA